MTHTTVGTAQTAARWFAIAFTTIFALCALPLFLVIAVPWSWFTVIKAVAKAVVKVWAKPKRDIAEIINSLPTPVPATPARPDIASVPMASDPEVLRKTRIATDQGVVDWSDVDCAKVSVYDPHKKQGTC